MLYDLRLEKTVDLLLNRQVSHSSIVLRQLSADHNEEQRFGGFLNNKKLILSDLGSHLLSSQDLSSARGRHIVSLQDSSVIDLSHRGAENLGYGSIGNGLGYGFMIHPHLLLDAENGHLHGLGSLYHHIGADEREKHKANKELLSQLSEAEAKEFRRARHLATCRADKERKYEEKMGFRWLSSARESLSRLGSASCVTVVSDCETDTYEYIVGLGHADFAVEGNPPCKVLVRSDNDRLLDIQKVEYNTETGKSQKRTIRLYEHLRNSEVRQRLKIEIPETPTRSKRTAIFELKYEKVKIRRPERLTEKRAYLEGKKLPKFMEVTAIEMCEVSPVPAGEKPIRWVLLTTHEIENDDFALKVIQWYKSRWKIEMYFRNLKKTGFNIENVLLKTGESILKFTFITLMSSVKIIQLLQARENIEMGIENGFSQDEIELIYRLNPTFEGKSEKLKNPYPKESMAYAVWVIARMGGWKGYQSQRKPGAYTLKVGIAKFYHFKEAFYILDNNNKQ